jgi:NADH:ubiquinone oxidoreductase subunit
VNKFLNKFFINLRANKVGADSFGNEYFEDKKPSGAFGRKRRFVMYKGVVEASKIPAAWFNWLHYQSNNIPKAEKVNKWEIKHQPNLTGTIHAYFPKGHVFGDAKRSKSNGDYEAWGKK